MYLISHLFLACCKLDLFEFQIDIKLKFYFTLEKFISNNYESNCTGVLISI